MIRASKNSLDRIRRKKNNKTWRLCTAAAPLRGAPRETATARRKRSRTRNPRRSHPTYSQPASRTPRQNQVTEDPATGSASGALGAYLVQNGVVEVGPTTEIVAEQGYEVDRPSRILIQVESDDDAIQQVKVGGQVVMVMEGRLIY